MPWISCPVCRYNKIEYEVDADTGFDIIDTFCKCLESPAVNDKLYFELAMDSIATPMGVADTRTSRVGPFVVDIDLEEL